MNWLDYGWRPPLQERVAAGAPLVPHGREPAGDIALQLAPRHAAALPAMAHATVVCDDGVVWLTQGDGEDYVLTRGERIVLHPRDVVVAMALAVPARLRLIAPEGRGS